MADQEYRRELNRSLISILSLSNLMYLCICEKVAENGSQSVFGVPFHRTQPARLAALTFF